MKDTIFRKYDIRGKVGSEMPLEDISSLTQAILYFFLQKEPTTKTIVVGADGRIDSPFIKQTIIETCLKHSFQVIDIGTCPTPLLYFSLHTIPHVDAGLMITASHNGKEYNGIKICLNKESVWGDDIQTIKQYYQQGNAPMAGPRGVVQTYDSIGEYIAWIKRHFSSLIGMPLSAIVDCGNGAAGTVLPDLIKAMQWDNVQLLYPEVDGTYPNHEADPIVEANMQDVKHILKTTPIQIGVGLDGDCDRMTPMSKEGVLVSGDKLLALFAHDILRLHPGAPIVFDIKCSSMLQNLLEQWGAQPCISPSGHSIIKDQMKKHQGLLAGELSCHFFFSDRYFGYDDGIYAMVRLFELIINTGSSLDQLLSIYPMMYGTPEIRIECPDEKKEAIVQSVKEVFLNNSDYCVLTIDGIRISNKHGWGILRSSNTQPVLCLRFEADCPEQLKIIENNFVHALMPFYNVTALREQLSYE